MPINTSIKHNKLLAHFWREEWSPCRELVPHISCFNQGNYLAMWLGTNNVYKVNDINFFTLQNANCYYSVKLVNCEKYHLAPTFKPLVTLWQYQIRTYTSAWNKTKCWCSILQKNVSGNESDYYSYFSLHLLVPTLKVGVSLIAISLII